MRILPLIYFFFLFALPLVSQADDSIPTGRYHNRTIFRHVNTQKLKFTDEQNFVIHEKNFKGRWRIEGTWEKRGDTLVLHETCKKLRRWFHYPVTEEWEVDDTSHCILTSDGLYLVGYPEDALFYKGKAWRNKKRELKGKPRKNSHF